MNRPDIPGLDPDIARLVEALAREAARRDHRRECANPAQLTMQHPKVMGVTADYSDEKRLRSVWSQQDVPVILRRGGLGEMLRARLPYSDDARAWLQDGRSRNPMWSVEHKCWELPKAWFNDLVDRALVRYDRIYIIQPYREQEKCAPACQNARGHECQCSCMGAHHGARNDGSWFEVSNTFSCRWHKRDLACRLMKRKDR